MEAHKTKISAPQVRSPARAPLRAVPKKRYAGRASGRARIAGDRLRQPGLFSSRTPVERITWYAGMLFALFLVSMALPALLFPWAWLPIVVINYAICRGTYGAAKLLWVEMRAESAAHADGDRQAGRD